PNPFSPASASLLSFKMTRLYLMSDINLPPNGNIFKKRRTSKSTPFFAERCLVHLILNFLSKVILLLFDSFTNFVTNKCLQLIIFSRNKLLNSLVWVLYKVLIGKVN